MATESKIKISIGGFPDFWVRISAGGYTEPIKELIKRAFNLNQKISGFCTPGYIGMMIFLANILDKNEKLQYQSFCDVWFEDEPPHFHITVNFKGNKQIWKTRFLSENGNFKTEILDENGWH